MDIVFSLEKVIYNHNQYAVLLCSTDDQIPVELRRSSDYPRKHQYLFSIKFNDVLDMVAEMQKRYQYKATGTIVDGKQYGYQFEATAIERFVSATQYDVIEYLRQYKGIGRGIAADIYRAFGEDTVAVVENTPEKLKSVKRVTDKMIAQIKEQVEKQHSESDALIFLSAFSLSPKKVQMIIATYQEQTRSVIEENPFILCSIEGIGFADANSIALDLNCGINSIERMQQAILYAHEKLCNQHGHVCVGKEPLIQATTYILHKGCSCSVQPQDVEKQMDKFIEKKILVRQYTIDSKNVVRAYIYSNKTYKCETMTAQKLTDFVHYNTGNAFSTDCINAAILAAQRKYSILLSKKQTQAVRMALRSNVSIVTGGPGTGKTTILKILVEAFSHLKSGIIRLSAPTGRAARRMAEATGILSACTIHSLLGIKPDTPWTEDCLGSEPIDADMLIIDEASMIDLELMHRLIHCVPFTCKLVILGDDEQLPSVGPGNVLRDLISSGVIPVTTLDVIYRQAQDSAIIANATKIRQDDNDFLFNKSDFIFSCQAESDIEQHVLDAYNHARGLGYAAEEIQVLSPYRTDKFIGSVNRLNPLLQARINPPSTNKAECIINHVIFRVGDRVIQGKNTDSAKNGDIGVITGVSIGNKKKLVVEIQFEDCKVEYTQAEMKDCSVSLAYAITGHKAQGSEYKVIIFPVSEKYSFLNKNLIYTIWTRAKERVFMVGNKRTLLAGSLKKDTNNRKTFLSNRMKDREEQHWKKFPATNFTKSWQKLEEIC